MVEEPQVETLGPLKFGEPWTGGPWKSGQSGNLHGRPKLQPLSRAYREKLDTPCPYMKGHTWAQAIAQKMLRLAYAGNIAAAAEIADRAEGKPRQALTIAREEENVDTYGIIARLTRRGAPEPEPGGVAPSSSDAVKQ